MKIRLASAVATAAVVAAISAITTVPARAAATAVDCTGPAGNPAPGTQAWRQRDAANQLCATERQVDELDNPAFGATFWSETPGLYGAQTLAQVGDPGHPHATLGQAVPGGTTTDPFRTLARWTGAKRGRAVPIRFTSTDGAVLNGNLFEPPPGKVTGQLPAVVITTGSIQGYQQMYFWAAEGLAEAGYIVMTFDVQGQGDSSTLPGECTVSACPGVPYQQNYNFFQGAEDAINWFLSTPASPYVTKYSRPVHNPLWASINTREVGIAGHSLGASAVSELGQCDKRIRALVAWDDLAAASGPCASSVTIPPADASASPTLTTPALGFNSEYFFNPAPMSSAPDPHAKDQGYAQLARAGDSAMQIALRSSMHLEYSYVPYILPASALGERVAFYYTLAWFDYYLKHQPSGYARLTAATFDASSDTHSIGGGTYSPTKAAADPTDPSAGNVAFTIAGLRIVDRLSFYYESEYRLRTPGGQMRVCADIRAGCPAKSPPTP